MITALTRVDLRKLGESSRLFTIKDGNKYRMKKAYLSYARALRLARGALLGSILDLDSAAEPAKLPKSMLRPEDQDIYNICES